MAAPFQDCAVLFGDSITSQQYVTDSMQALFCSAYRRTLDILNRGYGGYNTRWARQAFPSIFAKRGDPAPAIRLVTIWFGANDSVLADVQAPPRCQHVPVKEYEDNLRFFLESLTAEDSPYAAAHTPGLNIVLVTPPPVYVGMMDPKDPFSKQRLSATTKEYAEVVKRLGEEYASKQSNGTAKNWAIGTVDMYEGMLEAAGGDGEELREYLTDGLHLTSKGYGVFWSGYQKLVKGVFKDRGLDWEDLNDLPLRLPAWDAVDSDNPDVLAGAQLPKIRAAAPTM